MLITLGLAAFLSQLKMGYSSFLSGLPGDSRARMLAPNKIVRNLAGALNRWHSIQCVQSVKQMP